MLRSIMAASSETDRRAGGKETIYFNRPPVGFASFRRALHYRARAVHGLSFALLFTDGLQGTVPAG